MEFNDLYNLVVEAKGTKPGERFYNSKQSEGPSGMASSPVGKSNYNPEEFVPEKIHPPDKGMGDAISVIQLLGKAFQLLKNDEVFADQMRGVMNGFKKNRHQISGYQESVIKTKPKTIDNIWGDINRLITITSDPKKRKEPDFQKFVDELEVVKKRKDEHQAELDSVFAEIENVVGENEDINATYLEQMLFIVKDTAKRLYKKQSKELFGDKEEPLSRIVPMHELDIKLFESQVEKDAETQLKLLEMLLSEDESRNPLLIFLKLQRERYEHSKENFFTVNRGDNYSIAIEQLYRNLPLFAIVSYFHNVIMKSPTIKLNNKQSKRLGVMGSDGGMLDRLGMIKNEREFEEIRPDLIAYIKKQKVDKETKKMLTDIAKGTFQPVRGRANAAIKIISSLKANSIMESFDDFASSILENIKFDINDFKLDLMEISESKSKKCDGPTKKASSDRKGKKYTKCAKQPDGSYKRIHWGDSNAKVGGSDKRKRAFKKRHNCKNAKQGSANALSCNDWK